MLKQKQPSFCRKTGWKEQPFIFIVYLMNHIFHTSAPLKEIISPSQTWLIILIRFITLKNN